LGEQPGNSSACGEFAKSLRDGTKHDNNPPARHVIKRRRSVIMG